MKELKQQIIENWKSHLCDLIPYDSPNYEEELQQWAERLYEAEIEAISKIDGETDAEIKIIKEIEAISKIDGEFNQNEENSDELIEMIDWD